MWNAVNTTPFAAAAIEGRIGHPGHSLTLVVKGTFDLRPGERARPAEEQLGLTGDNVDPFGEAAYTYESDFAPFKPKADLLLSGSAHAPGGQPVPRCDVMLRVGGAARSLAVFGDREWVRGDDGAMRPGPPVPFRRMPIVYERAFGGAGWADNPFGKGIHPSRPGGPVPLPNVEAPEALIQTPAHRPSPAGFGPLGRTWAARASKLGTYDDAWLSERWPWFPADLDAGHFNAAPPQLQADFLRGDEEILLRNLHPVHSTYRAWLPALRVRCFLLEGAGEAERFREVPMNLDTVWIGMEEEKLVLVWRGVAAVLSAKHEEIRDGLVACEAFDEDRWPPELYRTRLAMERAKAAPAAPPAVPVDLPPVNDNIPPREVDPELLEVLRQAKDLLRKGGASAALMASLEHETDPDAFLARVLDEARVDPAVLERQKKKQVEEMRAALLAQGEDPAVADAVFGDDEPDAPEGQKPLTREDVIARHAGGAGLEDADLSGLDLSGLDLSRAKLARARLVDANLAGARLAGADLARATLVRADLREAVAVQADLEQADLTGAVLEAADLSEAKLARALVRNANLRRAKLADASAPGAQVNGSDLTGALLPGADLRRANLADTVLDQAVFENAHLAGAGLERARGEGVDLSGADFAGGRASEGARLPGLRARKLKGAGSQWGDADLRGADLSLAALPRASFAGADLTGADLHGADLAGAALAETKLGGAALAQANLFRADLTGADLTGADLRGASLYEAELLGTTREGASFAGALLAGTKLAEGAPKLPPGC